MIGGFGGSTKVGYYNIYVGSCTMNPGRDHFPLHNQTPSKLQCSTAILDYSCLNQMYMLTKSSWLCSSYLPRIVWYSPYLLINVKEERSGIHYWLEHTVPLSQKNSSTTPGLAACRTGDDFSCVLDSSKSGNWLIFNSSKRPWFSFFNCDICCSCTSTDSCLYTSRNDFDNCRSCVCNMVFSINSAAVVPL